ncbi:MAG: hypothetical protein WDM89_19465 [Rhizomicrobium sp.]
MTAHGALNCVNQQGVGNLVQSMRFSGDKVVATLRGTTKSGAPVVITSSADLRDILSVGMNGAKERCGTSENLVMQCKSGACVSVVDSSNPDAGPQHSYLLEFALEIAKSATASIARSSGLLVELAGCYWDPRQPSACTVVHPSPSRISCTIRAP